MTACIYLIGCVRYVGAVTVVPGSTRAHLVLQFGTEKEGDELPPVDAIGIEGGPFNIPQRYSAPHTYTWFIARLANAPSSLGALRQVEYGVLPKGFRQSAPALPLLPGRYVVEVRAGRERAKGAFVIDKHGVPSTSPP